MPAPELPDWWLEEEEGHSDNEQHNGETFADGSSRPDGGRKKFCRDPRLKVCLVIILTAGVSCLSKQGSWRPLM